MRLLSSQDPLVWAEIAAWTAARIPHMHGEFGACVGMGVLTDEDEPIAGIVFNNYQPQYRSIDISVASESRRWLTQPIIQKIMTYPFDQLDCVRVTAATPRRAASARQFLETFGFKREGLARKGFGDDDAVIYGLLKREWQRSRWAAPLKSQQGPNGQERTNSTAGPRPQRRFGRADRVQPADGAISVAAE